MRHSFCLGFYSFSSYSLYLPGRGAKKGSELVVAKPILDATLVHFCKALMGPLMQFQYIMAPFPNSNTLCYDPYFLCSEILHFRFSTMNIAFRLLRGSRRARYGVLFLATALILEILMHVHSYRVDMPLKPLDEPFARQCSVSGFSNSGGALELLDNAVAPYDVSEPRENATIVVLARNSDLNDTVTAIESLEKQWNQWYHYPITFLNDKPWEPAFKDAIRKVTKSQLNFVQIPSEMWSWPEENGVETPSREEAEAQWKAMKKQRVPYVGVESYHHMCRFYSGFFYDHPALASYKYYWRVEPEIQFTCRIPYDPFSLMRTSGKVYGYTIALWEIGSTCPTLFRTTADFKEKNSIPTTSLWTSMMDASWAPIPIRQLIMSIQTFFHSRTRHGDSWNFCHFWSNFEVADMDFFRSEQYRSYFAALDRTGGFYTERWGDAPVHSLALAMFAKPEQVHYFEDIGYVHPPFQNCPPEGVGCGCECSETAITVDGECLDKLRAGVK